MEYSKIKKAATQDPNTEFVYATYSGGANSRWAKKAVLVDTDKHSPIRWYGNSLNTQYLADQLAQPRVVSGRDYGVLAKISDLDGSNEFYAVIPTRHLKGLYLDYKDIWAKELAVSKQIDQLEKAMSKTRKEQETLHQTALEAKKTAVQDFLTKFAQWSGKRGSGNFYTIIESDALDLSTNVRVNFGTKTYPEFVANGYSFNSDPDVYEVVIQGSAEMGLDLMENLMESMLAIQDENKALALELEKEKRKNGN